MNRKPLTLLDHTGKPFPKDRKAVSRIPSPSAKYDAAQTDTENRRHWANADSLGANAANTPHVRERLRTRSRYEVANNSYAAGIVETLANDCVGPGPRLQLTTGNPDVNRQIESLFAEWSWCSGLAEKLWLMRAAKVQDGETFAILTNNPALTTPVQLDLKVIEAEQVASPWNALPKPTEVDGIKFDRSGNPTSYQVLKEHPGELFYLSQYDFDEIPASQVIHWYRQRRPGQRRGIPEITPALSLFAQLRRYTLAVIAAAETAADFAAVLETEAAGEDDVIPDPFEELEIVRRMMMTLPAGSKLHQFDAKQPVNTYEMFKREILCEIARCLNMPYNVAAGDSSRYNYASGRLDHQTYFKAIKVERGHCERIALDRIFVAWLDEALLIPGYLPDSLPPMTSRPWCWF